MPSEATSSSDAKSDPSTTSMSSSPPPASSSPSKLGLDKDRLSRALGAAFLQHQVSQLEKNVSSTVSQQQSSNRGRGGRGGRGVRGGQGQAQAQGRGTGINASPQLFNPLTDPIPLAASQHQHNSRGRGRGRGWYTVQSPRKANKIEQIRILDVSILCHGLPLVKDWCREATSQLIIPLDALSSLDILKNAPAPLKNAVWEATRFLDMRLSATSSSSHLVPQGTAQECAWEDVEKLFVTPTSTETSPSNPATTEPDDDLSMDQPIVASNCPKRIRSVLQCVAWHQNQHHTTRDVDRTSPCLVLYVPERSAKSSSTPNSVSKPPQDSSPDLKTTTTTSNRTRVETIDYDAISSGWSLAEWAPRFGLEIMIVSEQTIEHARNKNNAALEAPKRRALVHETKRTNPVG